MADCNPLSTPMDINQKLNKSMSPKNEEEIKEMENIPYQEAVGSILYLVQGTRPDLAFTAGNISRFNQNPGKAHWNAIKRLMRYLKGTKEMKLEFSKQGNSKIIGFSDADWGADVDDRRSCTGYVFILNGGAISWSSKRQATVALSSTEAEYMALSSATQEALWLKQFHEDLWGYKSNEAITIFTDNQSALHLTKNDSVYSRAKHIDIRYHFIRQHMIKDNISYKYKATDLMVADSLTKSVSKVKNNFCNKSMGLL